MFGNVYKIDYNIKSNNIQHYISKNILFLFVIVVY